RRGKPVRDEGWSTSIAVGSEAFVRNIQNTLGIKARARIVAQVNDKFMLKEKAAGYSAIFTPEKELLSVKNALKWNIF
ncbi:MAG: hypothetical protein ACRESK_02745, partial [Gammaproteobacteria bacterium]